MMSRITLALKRHITDLAATHPPGHIPNPLEWGAITRPSRIALSRGRVQYVERAPCDTSMLAVVSHIAGKEDDAKAKTTIVGACNENVNSIQMVELGDKELASPVSELSV